MKNLLSRIFAKGSNKQEKTNYGERIRWEEIPEIAQIIFEERMQYFRNIDDLGVFSKDQAAVFREERTDGRVLFTIKGKIHFRLADPDELKRSQYSVRDKIFQVRILEDTVEAWSEAN